MLRNVSYPQVALLFASMVLVASACEGTENAGDQGAPEITTSRSNIIGEGTDRSGRVHVQVKDCLTGTMQSHQTISCTIDFPYVLIGGGAKTLYGGVGAMLTESYPFGNGFDTWVASSKDHITSDPHYLQAYAIGMSIDGVNRAQLAAAMQIKSEVSGNANGEVNAQATTDENYVMTGGGAQVTYAGFGKLLTRSSPVAMGPENRTWVAVAKDHIQASTGQVRAYVIGIRPSLAGVDLDLSTRFSTASVAAQSVSTVGVSAEAGWVVASPGAYAEWSPGQGRLLTSIAPTPTTVQVLDKDHIRGDAGILTAYLRQIRLTPQ